MAFLDENGLAELWKVINEWGATDATFSMYGLNKDATPNTIFQKLAMPYGYYGFDVTVVTEDGSPVPGVVLNGLEDFGGNTPVTDENGRYAIAVSESLTPTLTIDKHIGIVGGTFALEANAEYVFTPITVTVQVDAETRFIDTTGEYRIYAPASAVVDLCAIGGGGGGGKSFTGEGTYGGGGGGGYCTNLLDISTISNGSVLSLSIGGGGAAGSGNGGTTLIKCNGEVLLQAEGGKGGTGYIDAGISSGGGAGNGRGGLSYKNTNGVDASVYLFDDTSLGLPGGGGGGGADDNSQAPGGKPYGGACGKSGTGTGGGGGAGDNMYITGAGYKGGAYVRVRYA